jgi:hypothetical protein
MFGRLLGSALVAAMLLGGANALQAQTTTTMPSALPTLDQCRDEAVRRNIKGDGLTAFLNTCLSTPISSTAGQHAGLDRCRNNATSRGLVGEARGRYIDDCMQQSGAMGSASTTGTYGYCRSQARGQNLSGTRLDEFLDRCVTH